MERVTVSSGAAVFSECPTASNSCGRMKPPSRRITLWKVLPPMHIPDLSPLPCQATTDWTTSFPHQPSLLKSVFSRPLLKALSAMATLLCTLKLTQFNRTHNRLGKIKLNGRTLINHLELQSGFNYWWMTLINEKCNWSKSLWINDAIRLLAFESFNGKNMFLKHVS